MLVQWSGVHKRLLVEENESPSADHHPAQGETDSKKNNFTACKYEFMRARDAAWGECPT